MTMSLTAAPQEVLGEPVKQILNVIPIKHIVSYIERVPINDYHPTSNCSNNSFMSNLAFRLQKQQRHGLPKLLRKR